MKNNADSSNRKTLTIANNTPYSDHIDNSKIGLRGLAVLIEGSWTAARIAVQVTDQNPALNPNWFFLRDDEFNLVTIANIPTSSNLSLVSFPAEVWNAGVWPYLRLVSVNTSSEAVVNQGAARTLKVSMSY